MPPGRGHRRLRGLPCGTGLGAGAKRVCLSYARHLQTAGAGLRSSAEPVVDTTSDFAELVLAVPGVAAKLERRRRKERTTRRREIRPRAETQRSGLINLGIITGPFGPFSNSHYAGTTVKPGDGHDALEKP